LVMRGGVGAVAERCCSNGQCKSSDEVSRRTGLDSRTIKRYLRQGWGDG
jgi:hypothetical protein